MRKVILNKCFGGYSFSPEFIAEYLERTGAKNVTYQKTVYAKLGEREDIPMTRDQFVEHSAGFDAYACVDGERFEDRDIERDDPVAVEILEELGSKACSGRYALLGIEKYNETKYAARIEEYDGDETLVLTRLLTPDMIRACKSTDEIIDLLTEVNAFVTPDKDCFTRDISL